MANPRTDKPDAKSPSKSRPIHLLIKAKPDSLPNSLAGTIEDLEVFTGELDARRALDGRDRTWSYLQLRPGTTYIASTKE